MYSRPFKKFFWWFIGMTLICFIGISNVMADSVPLGTQYATGQMCTSDGTCAWVENTNFYNGVLISTSSLSRRPRTFGWNVNINANVNSTYTAKFTLAFYYDYSFDLSGYWYFKDYISSANVQFGELNGNSKNVSCSTSALERSNNPRSDKIQVTCIFTPKSTGAKYYFLGVTNSSYANYGLVPFGSGTSFTIESNTMEVSTDNSSTIINQNQTIINQNQQQLQQQKETNENLNNLDDTLKDDDSSGATSEASDFFSSFNTNTFGLTSIISAPLNLIRSVLSSTCTDLQLPLPYLDHKKLTLPCMSTIYSQFFGSFFTIYQTITYGIIAYWVCVRIFNQVKDFKNPEHDEIEVMDL